MTATIVNLLLALFLLAANAFYVAAEFALVKSRGFRVNAMAEQNRFGARLIKKMVGNIEAYLACCQLGITMASLGLGWIGEPTVSAFLQPMLVPFGMPESALHITSFLIGFLVFSSLHIVVGEQVPKTLAIREPVPVSQWIAYPLHVSFLLLYPLNWLLNTASRSTLRMLGVREPSTHEILTDVEIEQLVEDSAEHGNIEEGQAEFIQNVFRFGELVVSASPEKVTNAVLEAARTRVPLWSGRPENIIGILHVKDMLRAIQAADGNVAKVKPKAIARPPWFVPDIRPLSEQIKAFRRRKTPFALVVDEYGEVMGLVTLEDILEEIVGDITDEYDVAVPGVRPQPDGSVNVDGGVPIRDLNRVMGWNLPDEEATTVAGLVIYEAQSIPEPGQNFTFHGFRFRVLRREKNRITALRITPFARQQALA
jgi:magnesium and cobalt exporter, CNNM family